MILKLRAAAERDLDGVFDYSVAQHGKPIAEAYMHDLLSASDRLLDHPLLGAVAGLRRGLRVLGVREHRLFYRIEGDTVEIVRVLHNAMDAGRHV